MCVDVDVCRNLNLSRSGQATLRTLRLSGPTKYINKLALNQFADLFVLCWCNQVKMTNNIIGAL